MLEAHDKKIVYHALERFPLPPVMVSKINYPQLLENPNAQSFFDLIHQARWDTPCAITPYFELLKMEQDLLTYQPDSLFDLIYFDAFGPDKQPELWSPQVFEKLGKATQTGGILTTYSVKGTVKRALKSAGFAIEKIPGPPGKREIIRATKI
jgi:tRNA U34 5-methylaminomethyl-2-thiouridine-forming methyltransferase MnmC